jgi:hypothetical protein
VRDVAVVVLDEATARMDPQTERRVTRAAERLLAGRTGIVVAHRLSTDALVRRRGGARRRAPGAARPARAAVRPARAVPRAAARGRRRADRSARAPGADLLSRGELRVPKAAAERVRPSLTRTVWDLLVAHPQWGLVGAVMFGVATVLGTYGTVTGLLWGRLVAGPGARASSPGSRRRCWRSAWCWPRSRWRTPSAPTRCGGGAVTLRLRLAVLRGQTSQQRLARTPPARSPPAPSTPTAWSSTPTAGSTSASARRSCSPPPSPGRACSPARVAAAVLVLSAVVSSAGAPLAGTSRGRPATCARPSAARSCRARRRPHRQARRGHSAVQRHLEEVDERRVRAR